MLIGKYPVFKETSMSLPEKFLTSEAYDHGFYNGCNFILALVQQNKTVNEIKEYVNKFENKYRETSKKLEEIKKENKKQTTKPNTKNNKATVKYKVIKKVKPKKVLKK